MNSLDIRNFISCHLSSPFSFLFFFLYRVIFLSFLPCRRHSLFVLSTLIRRILYSATSKHPSVFFVLFLISLHTLHIGSVLIHYCFIFLYCSNFESTYCFILFYFFVPSISILFSLIHCFFFFITTPSTSNICLFFLFILFLCKAAFCMSPANPPPS